MKHKEKLVGTDKDLKTSKNSAAGVKKKRKWIPEHKLFEGSIKEGKFNQNKLVSYLLVS